MLVSIFVVVLQSVEMGKVLKYTEDVLFYVP